MEASVNDNTKILQGKIYFPLKVNISNFIVFLLQDNRFYPIFSAYVFWFDFSSAQKYYESLLLWVDFVNN